MEEGKSGGKGLGKVPGKAPERGHATHSHVNTEVWRHVCTHVYKAMRAHRRCVGDGGGQGSACAHRVCVCRGLQRSVSAWGYLDCVCGVCVREKQALYRV